MIAPLNGRAKLIVVKQAANTLNSHDHPFWDFASVPPRALVQIGEFGRVHWSFGELRARGEQVEQDRRVVSRAALRP
jgi:hypothetical protein